MVGRGIKGETSGRGVSRTLDGFVSLDVWPLLVEALSTSFRLLPFATVALPLRRSRALPPLSACSFDSFKDCGVSLSGLRLGGMVIARVEIIV